MKDTASREGKQRLVTVALVFGLTLVIWAVDCRALWATNLTSVGSVTILPNFETMAITVAYGDDDNGNLTAVVEYRAAGATAWTTAFAPYIDRQQNVWSGESRTLAVNPNYKQIRTSIFGLARGLSYDVKVTVTDPDGVTGTNPATASAVTWSHDQPIVNGTIYYINSATGNDSNNGLTTATAWATVSKANSTAAPGSTVRLSGSFAGVTWTKSGTSGAYVKIESLDPGAPAVITSLFTLSANYVWLDHLHFDASLRTTGAEYCLIKSNTMHNHSGSYIGCVGLASGSTLGLLIDGNTIFNDVVPADESGSGIYINQAVTGRLVIRNNTIHTTWDGIGGTTNFAFDAGAPEGSDIYQNESYDAKDDGLEIEGGNVNVKIFRNLVHDSPTPGYGRVGIATAPVEIGPCFVFDNVIYNTDYGFKLGYGMGKGYYFNNTVWNVAYGAATAGGSAQNLEFVNNIWQASSYVYEQTDSYCTGWTTERNNWDNSGQNNAKWLGTSGRTLSWMQSNGQETASQRVASGLVNSAAHDFHLLSGSALIDAGKSMRGISFDFLSNVRPQGANFDLGAFEYQSSAPKTLSPPAHLRNY